MKPKTLLVGMALVAGLTSATISLAKEASARETSARETSEGVVRTVRGEVVAVNVTDFPQVIVVKTMTAKQQEMIVGATVESGATITRGKERVTLNSIMVGEPVELTYVKSQEGLVARSIHVR